MNNQSRSINNITILGNTLSKISFCDKQCSNIHNDKVKGSIIQHIENTYNINIIKRDYNIINPNTLNIISSHQHILSPYSNGNPYLLYLTKIDNINCCIYIDKKLKDGYTYPKMHCVKYRFNDDLFENDTILSGELVKDNERRWFFLIDNILLYKGMSTSDKNIISKFELIHNIFNNEYTQDKYLEICTLQIKKLFLYKDIKKMIEEFMPYLSYTCKGIVFYTLNNRCSNFAFLIPREKPCLIKSPSEINDIVQTKYPKLWAKQHSINNEYISNINNDILETNDITNVDNESISKDHVVFKILKTDIPDIYNLYCLDNNNNLYKHSIALVPNIKISHYLYNTFKTNPNNLDMHIECKYSPIFQKWSPVKFNSCAAYKLTTIENIETRLNNENSNQSLGFP